MKISKLFHLLYATVMFLPVFAIFVPCLIGVFNENSLGNSSLYDVFYSSVDNVIDSSLFNWAYNSNLLGVPVSYIGGIFGLAPYSAINVLLCYWLAYSIIWLVFDVLMFVPLLVHKSIDKLRF